MRGEATPTFLSPFSRGVGVCVGLSFDAETAVTVIIEKSKRGQHTSISKPATCVVVLAYRVAALEQPTSAVIQRDGTC